MFSAVGDKWKRLRSVASPIFTTRRMKEMSPLINQSVDDLLMLFDERCQEGKPFDIYAEFGRLTLDVISSCAFGIDTGCLKDSSSPFLVETRKLFNRIETLPAKLKAILLVIMLFPDLIVVQSLGVKNRPYCSLLAGSAKTCVVLGWVI